ncbi:hypothetical protein HN51_012036 [Arachis hypogaea]
MAELLRNPPLEELLKSNNLYLLLIKNNIINADEDLIIKTKDLIIKTKEKLFYGVPFIEVKEQDCPPILEDILDVSKVACPTILLLRGSQLVSHYPYYSTTATQLSFSVSPYIEADIRDLMP